MFTAEPEEEEEEEEEGRGRKQPKRKKKQSDDTILYDMIWAFCVGVFVVSPKVEHSFLLF